MTYMIGLALLVLLLVIAGMYFLFRKKKKKRSERPLPESIITPSMPSEEPLLNHTALGGDREAAKRVPEVKPIESALGYQPPPVIELGQRKVIKFRSAEEEEAEIDLGEHSEWLLQTISFYRDMGFFAAYAEESDRKLAHRLMGMQEEEWGQEFTFHDPYFAQLEVLIHDKERIWFEDAEAGVAMGKQIYTAALKNLSRISRGVFLPEEIDEVWAGPKGPIHVEFTHLGQRYRMGLEYNEKWMDIWGLVLQLNQVVVNLGYQFEIAMFDQNAFVTLLNPREKRALKRERGLDFFKPVDMMEWKKQFAK